MRTIPHWSRSCSQFDEAIGIPVIAVEEQLRAWLAQIHRSKTVYSNCKRPHRPRVYENEMRVKIVTSCL